MDSAELKDRLDLAARAGAIVLIALYSAGFLVVSFHNATYGIVEFGLFRTRLLSAGIIFAIFLGIPFLEASKIFGLFGFERIGFPNLSRLDEVVAFFLAAWGSIFIMRFIVGDLDFSWRPFLVWLCFPAIASAVFVAKGFKVLPKTMGSVIEVILCVASLIALILVREWTSLRIIAWFMLVGWITYQMDSPIRNPKKLTESNWVRVFFNFIVVFGFFADLLYPRIEPILGGGRPTDIVLQFTTASPVDNSTRMEVWLVDETDAGYYFIRTPEDRKAVFVPKSLVSAVYFQAGKPLL